ncbi:MAG: hypothetical protein ACRDPP_00560 [Gaiellaceae bacterium]
MTELERALARLGADLAFPETPDVVAAVGDRLEQAAPVRRRRPSRRVLVVAFVALALAAGAAMAVPAARAAILEFFGLRGATVTRVDTLPPVETRPEAPVPAAEELDLGSPVPIVDGLVRVKWPYLVVPDALGPPDAAYYSTAVLRDGKVSLVYEPGAGVPRSLYTGVGILVTEFRGDLAPGYVEKLADAGTGIERLSIGPHRAIWLEGGPHFVAFRTPGGNFAEDVGRLAGNTLLVERGRLLVRVEGELERDRAVEIARSLARP